MRANLFRAVVLLSFVALLNGAYAQPAFQWANQIGDIGNDNIRSIIVDGNGDILVGGAFTGTVDFDPSAGTNALISGGGRDAFIAKYDDAGALIWVKKIATGVNNCDVNKVRFGSNGDIFVSGHFQGTADFDPSVGISNFTSVGSTDWFVSKYDNSGNFVWGTSTGSTAGDEVTDIAVTSTNDVIVVGYFADLTDFDPGAGTVNINTNNPGWEDGFIYKLDNSGNLVWVKTMQGTSGTDCFGVAINATDDIYVTGSFVGTVDLDPNAGVLNVPSAGSRDAYVIKMDPTGAFTWGKAFGGTGSDYARCINLDASGNVLSAGQFHDNLDIEPGPSTTIVASGGGSDLYFQKLDPSGNFIWGDGIGGTSTDFAYDITADASDNVYISGFFQTTVDFDPGTGTNNLTANSGLDGFTMALSSTKSFLWVAPLLGTGTEVTTEVAVGNAGELYLASQIGGTVDVDPSATVLNYTTNGLADIVITKLSDCVPTAPTPDLGSLPDINGECSVSTPTAPTASSCVGTFNGTPDVTFPITSQGTTMVTWTYNDGSGNTSTQTQNVVIADVTAPVPDVATLTDVTDECTVSSLTPPTATDNCATSVTVTNDATLPITAQGTTIVTWTYDDGNGNTSTQAQNIVITDATTPVADVANLSDINSECEVTPTAPTATDNCSGAVTATPDVTFPITASGTTTITWTYDDGNGNTATQTQDVIITPIDNGITQVDATTLSADATGYTYQWVDCDDLNAPVAGATNQTFTPTVAGNYACEVSNGTCTVTTACLSATVGITENDFGADFILYPNPTKGNLRIDLGNDYEYTSVRVYNALGQLLINESFVNTDKINIEIEGEAGMYVVEIQTKKGKFAKLNVIKSK